MTSGIRTRNLLIAGACSVVFMVQGACSGKDEQKDGVEPAVAERPDPMSREERLEMRRKIIEDRGLERVPEASPTDAADKVTGEVPDELIDKIYSHLESQTGAQRAQFTLLQAEARQWNDGALGCPEPGQVYTQAIVDGYQVVIDYQGQSFDYHASASGFFKLCSGFRPNR